MRVVEGGHGDGVGSEVGDGCAHALVVVVVVVKKVGVMGLL